MLKNGKNFGFSPELEFILSKNDYDPKIINSISWDILSLFMADYYSEYYKDSFYDNMLEIYLSGHIPCGFKDGKSLVY